MENNFQILLNENNEISKTPEKPGNLHDGNLLK